MITIDNKEIGKGFPVFVVAELSANHLYDIEIAKNTIKAMCESGADAVKLQTYTPDTITIDSDKEYFQIRHSTLWDGKTLYSLYKEAYTPWEWHAELKKLANDLGLILFSSPFDNTSVDFLEEIDCPAYKIASFEMTDIPLIEYVASKGKPVIMSTGIATKEDIEEAVAACRRSNNDQIILLKCTSGYPAPVEEINLKMIPELSKTFNVDSGISDHTLGIDVSLAAVALGACVVEKHFIMDRNMKSVDAAFSIEPQEFKEMVASIRKIERAVGKVDYGLTDIMKKNRDFSRSLFIVQDIEAGEVFTEENIKSIRPGVGLQPKFFKEIIGKRAKGTLSRGTPLSWELIEQ